MIMARFKEGDWVRATVNWCDIKIGDACKVDRQDGNGYWVYDHLGDLNFMGSEEIEPWTPRVGERVRFVRDNSDGGAEYGAKGEIATVADADLGLLSVTSPRHDWNPDVNITDIEPVIGKVAADAPDEPKFKVGDRVRVTDAVPHGWFFNAGDVGEIAEVGKKFDFQYRVKLEGHRDMGHVDDKHIELVADPAPVSDGHAFKPGDRVRVSGHPYHLEADESRGVITAPSRGRGDWEIELDGYGGRLSFFESEMEIELVITTTPLKIEAGKFYMTRDGRKVGPIVPFNGAWSGDVEGDERGRVFQLDGKHGNEFIANISRLDLIAEAPTTTTTAEIGTAIVCLIRDGKPLPATEPYVHADQRSASQEMRRLADLHKGDTFGVYKLMATATVKKPTYDHEWQRLAAEGLDESAASSLAKLSGLTWESAHHAVMTHAA